jgi:hypothetical protein
VSGAPPRDVNSTINGVAVVISDVTRGRLLAEELRNAQSMTTIVKVFGRGSQQALGRPGANNQPA